MTGGVAMKITIKDIMLNKDVLFKLVQNKWDSPKKSYEVYRFYMEIESHIAFFERERAKLARTLGEPCGEERYQIKPENQSEYNQEIERILDVPIELPSLSITIDDIANTQYTDNKDSWYTPIEFYKFEKFLEKANASIDTTEK